MLTLHGSGVGKGIAVGQAYVLRTGTLDVPVYTVHEQALDAEVRRFRGAIDEASSQLSHISDGIPKDAPAESRSFIEAYQLMLRDPIIAEKPVDSILRDGVNAEHALEIHAAALIEAFDNMEDDYLRSRKADVQHVVNRIQSNLLGVNHQTLGHSAIQLKGKIVVAHDLSPADAVQLKNHEITAFATDLGGPISHTAILARSLNIPAIVGLHGAIRYIRDGETLVVDGKRGALLVGADRETLEQFEQRKLYISLKQRELSELTHKPCVTRDGTSITLMANIELPDDIDSAVGVSPDGVGLYRTEYLFMNRSRPPQESEQFNAYCRVLERIKRPVTIRTLDLGADKQVDGGRQEDPTNPALGLRAVRLCLKEPALFKPQLRAILRASALGPVQAMIPMVSSLDELTQVLDLVEETKNELKHENLAFNERIPIGGMIEVPAAAIAADLFAARLDFLSIGTNDLIQYTLAIDRVDDAVNYLYDPLHPSVLRLIKLTIDAGRRAGIPVAMCGEMAGDTRYSKLLMGLGLRNFSMDTAALLEVKKQVLETDLSAAEDAAQRLLDCTDAQDLRRLALELENL